MMQTNNTKSKITGFLSGYKASRRSLLLPCLVLLLGAFIWMLPGDEPTEGRVSVRTLRVADFPIVLVYEQQEGSVTSAWLRTPAGSMKIEEIEGLSFISDSSFVSNVDNDTKDDLMWRISFTNFAGDGVHLWIGMTTWSPKLFIFAAPYQYTRWDVIPAKLVVPKGTAVYVSPATPSYNKAGKFSGKESYSFVYTVRMTPEGPAFVPVPDVYKQLAVLLKAGIQGEYSPMKRLAYVRMLEEFNNLASGKPPQAETMLNFQMQKIGTLSWKR